MLESHAEVEGKVSVSEVGKPVAEVGVEVAAGDDEITEVVGDGGSRRGRRACG